MIVRKARALLKMWNDRRKFNAKGCYGTLMELKRKEPDHEVIEVFPRQIFSLTHLKDRMCLNETSDLRGEACGEMPPTMLVGMPGGRAIIDQVKVSYITKKNMLIGDYLLMNYDLRTRNMHTDPSSHQVLARAFGIGLSSISGHHPSGQLKMIGRSRSVMSMSTGAGPFWARQWRSTGV